MISPIISLIFTIGFISCAVAIRSYFCPVDDDKRRQCGPYRITDQNTCEMYNCCWDGGNCFYKEHCHMNTQKNGLLGERILFDCSQKPHTTFRSKEQVKCTNSECTLADFSIHRTGVYKIESVEYSHAGHYECIGDTYVQCFYLMVLPQPATDLNRDCYDEDDSKYLSYNGRQTLDHATESCINWKQIANLEACDFPQCSFDHNYCRNPDQEEGTQLWCFTETTSSGVGSRYRYCYDVPICTESHGARIAVQELKDLD